MKTTCLFLLYLTLSFQSLVLVPQPEEKQEIKLDLTDQPKAQPEKQIDASKIYAVQPDGYKLIKNSFKNVVLILHEQENEEETIEQLTNALQKLDIQKYKLDIIFLCSNFSDFNQETNFEKPGIYVTHYNQEHYLDLNEDQLYTKIREIVRPSLKPIEESNIDQYLSGDKPRALLVIQKDSPNYNQIIESLENILQNDQLQESHIEEIKQFNGESYNQYTQPALLLYKPNYELEKYQYNLTYTDQVVDFLFLESLPLVVPLDASSYARVFGGSIAVFLNNKQQSQQTQLHLLIDDSIDNTELIKAYQRAAIDNKDNDLKYERVIFCYSNYTQNQDLWQQFDFDANVQKPKLAVTRTNFRKFQLEKFVYDQEDPLNTESIIQFVRRFREKEVTQFFKSEPLPDPRISDGVVKVVGQTFTDEVLKGKQNILILFWDSKNPEASVNHEALLKDTAKEIPEDKQEYLKIAMIDLALNEHPKITLDQAPTIQLYLAGDKRRPKEYLKSQDLVVDQMKSWLTYWIMDLELVKFDERSFHGNTKTDI